MVGRRSFVVFTEVWSAHAFSWDKTWHHCACDSPKFRRTAAIQVSQKPRTSKKTHEDASFETSGSDYSARRRYIPEERA